MTSASPPRPWAPSRIVMAAVLVALVVLVFGQVVSFEFLDLDDPEYVTANPPVLHGLTLAGVGWALTTHHAAMWHPLTWMTHMLDVDVWGMSPGGHHVGNVVLHAASTVLLFLSFDRLTGQRGRSFVLAALFAVHPLRADSIAWVAERKDALCTFFSMVTLWAYARYARAPSWRRMAGVTAAFVCALMAKPMAVSFPAALLLIDAWPLGRLSRATLARCLVEKLPLGVLSLAAGLWTLRSHSGALVATPLRARVLNAVVSCAEQLGHVLFPYRLAIYYPRPFEGGPPLTALAVLVAGACLLALVGVAFWLRRTHPAVAFGTAWFLVLLFPVSGVLQSGLGRMADRFTYVPGVGVTVAVVWLVADLLEGRGLLRRVGIPLASAAIVALGCAGFANASYYHDSERVFAHAQESTGNNWMAESHLGSSCLASGDPAGAIAHFRRVLEWVPDATHALEGLAQALEDAGQSQESIDVWRHVLRDDPANARAQNGVCVSLVSLHKVPEAISCLERAICLDPNVPVTRLNLSMLYRVLGLPPKEPPSGEACDRLVGKR